MKLVVVGCSAGGLAALEVLLGGLAPGLDAAWLIVQHRAPDTDDYLSRHLDAVCPLRVVEAADKLPLERGVAYVTPGGYHTLVERERTLSLSIDPPVHHCRPAIDVTLESAARAFGADLVGVLLTGANDDGVDGLRAARARGGRALVQDPATAEVSTMPAAAVAAGAADTVAPLAELAAELNQMLRAGP